MKKPKGSAPRTHFEQVPLEIVKKIAAKDAPKPEKPTPLVPPRSVRNEV